MFIIEECISGKEVFYRKWLSDEKKELVKEIRFKLYSIYINDSEAWILYDSNMNVIEEVFVYLNEEKKYSSKNTKRMIAFSMKLLYEFCDLFELEIRNFNSKNLSDFDYFIMGLNIKGISNSMIFKTQRKRNTRMQYLSFVCEYLKYLCIENLRKKPKNNNKNNPLIDDNELIDYRAELPMYITKEEYINILNVVNSDYSLRDEIIIRLMRECGMRIGEVLGITLEDLEVVNSSDKKTYGKLILRNRLSDRNDQSCKTLMNITNISQYKSEDYWSKEEGYYEILVGKELLMKIDKYIKLNHEKMSRKKRKNYLTNCKADSVIDDEYLNFYIFLNFRGGSLTQNGWNKTLRQIFTKAGIRLDYKKKEHNLNHKFRHYFAIDNVINNKLGVIELKDAMRHKSVISSTVYFNLPDEEKRVLIDKIEKEEFNK